MKKKLTSLYCTFLLFNLNIGYSQANEKAAENLPTIIITGSRWSGIDGWASTGSKSPIGRSLFDTPASIEILDSGEVADSSPQRIEDVVYYVSGVQASNNQSGFSTSIFARGFNSEGYVFLNGHRDNQQFYLRDFATVERVELLKGHSSVLYGSGTPGASLNYITKQPLTTARSEINVGVGDHLFRTAFDTTGPIFDSPKASYRLVSVFQEGETLYDNVNNNRSLLAPSLSYKYDKGLLKFEGEYAETTRELEFGIVRSNEQILFNKSYVDPRAYSDRRYGRASVYVDHNVTPSSSFIGSIHYFSTRRNDQHIGFANKLDESTLIGFFRKVEDDYAQINLRSELQTQIVLDRQEHAIAIGLEQFNSEDNVISKKNIGGFTLDTIAPNFDTPITSLILTDNNYRIRSREKSLFLHDSIKLGDFWLVDIGTRYSAFDAEFKKTKPIQMTNQKTLSNAIGINYQINPSVSLYGGYSESFLPNWGRDINDQFFDPMTGKQYEIGFRKRNWGGIDLHFATYLLDQDNLTTTDPQDPSYQILAGQRRSKGFEIELGGNLHSNLGWKATYAYTDATIRSDNDGFKGNIPGSIPSHSGSIQLTFVPKQLNKNMKISIGLIGVDERHGDDKNTFSVPGFGRTDLSLSFSNDGVRFGCSVENLFDKEYVAASFREDDMFQGNRRTLMCNVNRKF